MAHWVNENTGERRQVTNHPFHGEPWRSFGDDYHGAEAYSKSVKSRIEAQDQQMELARKNQKAIEEQAESMRKSQEEMESQMRNIQRSGSSYIPPSPQPSYSSYPENNGRGGRKMHWIYFLLIGWWLGLCLACLIVPLFIKGLVKKSFGYW